MDIDVRKTPLLILFGGAGREGVIRRLKNEGYSISAIVSPAPRQARLENCLSSLRAEGFRVLDGTKEGLSDTLKEFPNHVLLSVGYPRILKPEQLALFPLCLNIHPTLLPKYRGPTTGAYIILNGEKTSGTTMHVMDEGVDTGPIVLQKIFPIDQFDTVRSVQFKAYALEPDMAAEAFRLLCDRAFEPTPQDPSKAIVYTKRRTPDDNELDPSRPLAELFDQIRACDPDAYPAFVTIHGQKVCIKLWRPNRPEGAHPLSI